MNDTDIFCSENKGQTEALQLLNDLKLTKQGRARLTRELTAILIRLSNDPRFLLKGVENAFDKNELMNIRKIVIQSLTHLHEKDGGDYFFTVPVIHILE